MTLTKESIQYRPAVWDDFAGIANLFQLTWPSAGSEEVNELNARYFTAHYLENTTFSQVALAPAEHGKEEIVGVVLADIYAEPKSFPQAHAELEKTVRELNSIEGGERALDYANRTYLKLIHELEDDCDVRNSTQAELELFLVSPKMRGLGVGGSLWRALHKALANAGVQEYFLHTDSSCDFSFYDHKGLTRADERMHANHPEDDELPVKFTEDLFVYVGKAEQA